MTTYTHSSVSLDYLEQRNEKRKAQGKDSLISMWALRGWRSQGYTYAPPCDNIRPDGHCAGHRKED